MARIKDNPEVQTLLNKETDKATKAAHKEAALAAKLALDDALDIATAEEDPVAAKAAKRHLTAAKKAVLAVIKAL